MNKSKHDEALNLIERVGLFFEQSGYLPSAARVYALLMIWEKPELHFDEIQNLLDLSKGATSKAINDLIVKERIEAITKPGVRKKFYKIRRKPGEDSTINFVKYLTTMKMQLEAIEVHKEKYGDTQVRFGDEIKFFNRLIELFNGIMEE
jgi:DNA-binding transcriptional regulator GbsR (MarR family)